VLIKAQKAVEEQETGSLSQENLTEYTRVTIDKNRQTQREN